MKTTRLLLPFTHGVDMEALEFAVLLAKDRKATLVPLALVPLPDIRRLRGARLEHIQQAKDFLEAAQHKAAKHDVSVERFEVFTSDAVQSVGVLVQQLECDGILLFARGSDSTLLSTGEARRLREKAACMFYIVRLPMKRRAGLSQVLRKYLSNWLSGRRKREEEMVSMQTFAESAEQPHECIPGSTQEMELDRVEPGTVFIASRVGPTWEEPGGGRDKYGPYSVVSKKSLQERREQCYD